MSHKRVVVAIVFGMVLLGGTPPALATSPTPNQKNCAGVVTSDLASPGFGALVSSFAQLQLVDNFGLAACGEPPRRNG